MPTIPQDLAIVLAVLASFISNGLRSDGLSRWQNMLIAGASFLMLSLVAMWLIGGFSGSLRDNVLYFVVLAVMLSGNELLALVKYLQEAQSPLVPTQGGYQTQPLPPPNGGPGA